MNIQNTFKKISAVAIVCTGIFFALPACAATLTLIPPKEIVHRGQQFTVDVMLDPQGETVNAVSATIDFPSSLTYVASDDSSSIISEWVDTPTLAESGTSAHFSGIIVGGFSGYIDPFNLQNKKPGVLVHLIFTANTIGSVTISLSGMHAYLNDGMGTATSVSALPLALSIENGTGPTNTPLADTVPPMEFTPLLVHNPLLYAGSYAVVFSTKDAGSGIDYYEVKEGSGNWIRAVSPYVLTNQNLTGTVLVKAVDHAGNERIESVAMPAAAPARFSASLEIGLCILVLIIFCAIIVRRWHLRKTISKK